MRVLGVRRIALLGETFLLLLAARMALALLPVQRVLAWNGRRRSSGSEVDSAEARSLVRWLIRVVARRSPVEFVCFPQSLVARILLNRRGIESRLYYGVARREGKLTMHTWLEADGEIVVGGEVAAEYTVIAVY